MQPQQQWHPPRWQYRVVSKIRNVEQELNRMGAEGWELVAIDSDPQAKVVSATQYVFKRPY